MEYLDRYPNGFFAAKAKRLKQYDMVKKFWVHIERNLRDVLNHRHQDLMMYFAGGTLCIDGKNALYMLHINGKGSVNPMNGPLLKNSMVIMPDYITSLVQKVYLQAKGATGYYREESKDLDEAVLA